MKWSWKLGEFRGIAVYMHATFLILVAFIVLSHWTEGHSLGKTLEGVGFILALFGCVVVNVSLLIFNMLPAFPMDGGRVLRALLATRLQYARATQIAASIGQAMALVFSFLGFFGNPFLMFIALFVWIGAAQEASMATMKAALGGIPVSHAMMTNFSKLRPNDSL